MTPGWITTIIAAYFIVLILISYFTSKGATSDSFYTGDKKSPWYVVAFGMIGASLSGVTFISVPGWVESSQFSYMQMVLGYLVGYGVIAYVLMPIYYKMNLTSIYEYLRDRFGIHAYRTGSVFFIISRVMGAAFRLYLVAMVFQKGIFDQLDWDVPFGATVVLTIALIWVYTFKGGIKTIIWTDTLQTLFMLLAVVVTIYLIGDKMELGIGELIVKVKESDYSKVFYFDDWSDKKHFVKQFLSGALIAIVMTGLDQDMMQKNLTCKNLKEAQTNVFSFSIVLVLVNLLFLGLGALLYMFAAQHGIEYGKADMLYPTIAIQGYLGIGVSLLFILGLVAAAYSSADSALTALTTSVCVDLLDTRSLPEEEQKKKRLIVHVGISVLLVLVIMLFDMLGDASVISKLFVFATYTYGPLLGMYALGIFTKYEIEDRFIPVVCALAPLISYLVNTYSSEWFGGFQFGYLILALNGLLTFGGMMIFRKKSTPNPSLDAAE